MIELDEQKSFELISEKRKLVKDIEDFIRRSSKEALELIDRTAIIDEQFSLVKSDIKAQENCRINSNNNDLSAIYKQHYSLTRDLRGKFIWFTSSMQDVCDGIEARKEVNKSIREGIEG